jgi:Bcr/CflA subfamily drug resistance transporter
MRNWQKLIFPYALVFYEAVLYLANDMYLPSLPAIARDLKTSQDMVQYTLALWFLGTCSLQVFLGPLSDYFGRRQVLVWGSGLFFGSTLMCTLSHSIEMLLFARFLQGSVVGTVVVAGYAAIHEFYDSRRTVQLLSIMASIIVLAPAVGPVIGAWILEFYSWRVIFSLLAGMGAIGVIGIYFSMPKDILRTKVSIEKVIQDYKSILSNRLFLKYALSFGFIISSFFIWIVEGPFVIIEGLKLEPSVFGWMQVLIFGSFGIGAQLAKRLIKKQSVAELVRFSMMIIMGGACAFMLLSLVTNNLYWIVSSVVMISVGASMAFGSLNRLAIEASEASMGNRTAAFSLLVSAVGTFASFVMTLFNNRTFLNLSVVMAVFIVGGVALIWPKSKKIRFSESS